MIFDDIEFVNISGTSIFDIPDEQSMTSSMINDSDLFVISQRLLTCVQPDRIYEMVDGTVLNNERGTHKISYEDLSITLVKSIMPKIKKFNSMAYELSDHYSLIDHIHNYSNVEVNPVDIEKTNSKETIYLGKFIINNIEYEINMQRQIFAEPDPNIGELKFIGKSIYIQNNDDQYYKSNDFNGWVYADGRALSRIKFKKAFEYFGTDYGIGDGSTTFNIPNFRHFFKPISDISNKNLDLRNIIPYRQQVLLQHTHNYSNSSSLTINDTYEIQYITGTVDSTGLGMCSYKGGSSTGYVTGTIDFNIKNKNVTGDMSINSSDSSLDVETYPTHNLIPVLIYVGKYEG